jgi:hypothetical protein
MFNFLKKCLCIKLDCQLFTSLLDQFEKCWQTCIVTTSTKWQCLNKTCSTISVSSFLSFRFNSAKLWVRRNNFTASNHVNATNDVTTHKFNVCINIMTVTSFGEEQLQKGTEITKLFIYYVILININSRWQLYPSKTKIYQWRSTVTPRNAWNLIQDRYRFMPN